MLHCHVEWHLQAGLAAQFIEAPLVMQNRFKIPNGVVNMCKELGVGVEGNAAGYGGLEHVGDERVLVRYREYLEAKGIVALVACILSAISGLVVIILVS
jgi:iron transport multicopper oxidase